MKGRANPEEAKAAVAWVRSKLARAVLARSKARTTAKTKAAVQVLTTAAETVKTARVMAETAVRAVMERMERTARCHRPTPQSKPRVRDDDVAARAHRSFIGWGFSRAHQEIEQNARVPWKETFVAVVVSRYDSDGAAEVDR
jgi:hypothetical protein